MDHKAVVFGYNKWNDEKPLEVLLNKNSIDFIKVKKIKGQGFGFIHFASEQIREESIARLKTLEFNGKLMEVKVALPKGNLKPITDGKKRKLETQEEQVQPNCVMDVVTPWWQMEYDQQLVQKEIDMRRVLVRLTRASRKEYVTKIKRIIKEVSKSIRSSGKVPKDDCRTKEEYYRNTVPNWLSGEGHFYTIKLDNSGLYRSLQTLEQQDWEQVGFAHRISSMTSCGGYLLGVDIYGTILKWIENDKWSVYGRYEDSKIMGMEAYQGKVVCVLENRQLVVAEKLGRDKVEEWKSLGEMKMEGLPIDMTVHDRHYYVCFVDEQGKCRIAKSELKDKVDFERVDSEFDLGTVVGMASHNGQLIFASKEFGIIAFRPDVSFHVPENTNSKMKDIIGFASHKGLCCVIDDVVASPKVLQYRNKCEFSIGYDADGKPCVGFRIGTYKSGSVSIAEPSLCNNVPESMVYITQQMQHFIENSKFKCYDRESQDGVWRSLLVRWSDRTQDLMVMVQVKPVVDRVEEYEMEKQSLINDLSANDAKFKVTSLYWQDFDGVSAPKEDHPVMHVAGKEHSIEKLMDLKFEISPQAFFQVNTAAAEELYKIVCQYANPTENTLVYDVCCGTGTIGLAVARSASRVVGVELCAAAIEDAKRNMQLNNIQNISFINAKAEEVMGKLLQEKKTEADAHVDNIVAIVDPPRGGLHIDVLRALRGCRPLTRIVYVSCNPSGTLIDDAAKLCGPNTKSMKGDAFYPVHATPVDLFPSTSHCEMVVVFERLPNEKSC